MKSYQKELQSYMFLILRENPETTKIDVSVLTSETMKRSDSK